MMIENTTIDRWGRELAAAGYAEQTVRVRTRVVALAAKHAGVPPDQLTRDDVLAWISAREYKPWTRRKYLEHVRAWCSWAGIPDATAGIKRPRQPPGIPRPVSEADLAAMLTAAQPGHETAWVVLGAFAGLRSFETAKLRAGDLTCPAGAWLLEVEGKGGQLAVIPAAPIVVQVLGPLTGGLPAGARLWPDATSRHVQYTVAQVAARAGVACTSHQLRHRYGTMLYAGGQDLLETQRLMRHASPATTAGYAAVAPDKLAAAVAALPGAAGPNSSAGQPTGRPLYLVR